MSKYCNFKKASIVLLLGESSEKIVVRGRLLEVMPLTE